MGLLHYFKKCFAIAFKGSFQDGLNWAGILGLGLFGMFREYSGAKVLLEQNWQDIVYSGVVYTLIAWVAILFIRFIFFAPYSLYKQQNKYICELQTKAASYKPEIDLELRELHRDGSALNGRDKSSIDGWHKKVHERISKILPEALHKLDTNANIPDMDSATMKMILLESLSEIISDYQKRQHGA